ncbi:MAG: L-histidine N(alpha)-methyltransferase [Solirubrobacterales bacterium]
MTRPPFIDVVVHESVHPEALAAELRDGLAGGEVATRQHYVSARQARLWREIAAAFSPARDEADGVRAYDAVNGLVADRVSGAGAHVIGLGCGDGAKERRLLDALAGTGPLTATPVDVSLPLVQVAVDRLAGAAGTALGRPVVCDLGLAAADLPAMVGEAPGPRVVTLYGILPGMEAFAAMAAALSLLRPGDLLAVSANLLPEGDDALEAVTAQYDNEQTRSWLGALLEDAGLRPEQADVRIGELSEPGTGAVAAVGAWLEPREEVELVLEAGEVRLEPGSPVRLLRSARHTPEGLEAIVLAAGLELLALEVSPTGEEGVALAAAPTG